MPVLGPLQTLLDARQAPAGLCLSSPCAPTPGPPLHTGADSLPGCALDPQVHSCCYHLPGHGEMGLCKGLLHLGPATVSFPRTLDRGTEHIWVVRVSPGEVEAGGGEVSREQVSLHWPCFHDSIISLSTCLLWGGQRSWTDAAGQ